jgi:hypothetical protein
MPEKEYLILLDEDARKRHCHLTKGLEIIKFMVQLEVKSGDEWKAVVRYDCAHDYAHKDCYDITGRRRKLRLYLSYEDALTLADDDINENWQIYRQRFLEGKFP